MSTNTKATANWKDNDPDKETAEKWKNDSNNWKCRGLFYYNKEDKRLFVPKRVEWMGITLNFANPKSKLALLIAFAFFGTVIFMILNKNI